MVCAIVGFGGHDFFGEIAIAILLWLRISHGDLAKKQESFIIGLVITGVTDRFSKLICEINSFSEGISVAGCFRWSNSESL